MNRSRRNRREKGFSKLSCFGVLGLLILVIPLTLPAMDFGADIDNATGFRYEDDFDFTQKDKLTLWFASPLGKYLDINTRASYTYSLERPVLVDLDLLDFSGRIPIGSEAEGNRRVFSFHSGRVQFADFSGWVLDHTLDGVVLDIGMPAAQVTAGFGYLGLHLKPVSTIAVSREDDADRDEDDTWFAAPRLAGIFQLRLFEILPGSDLYAAAAFQTDLRSKDDVVEVGEVYYQPGAGGRVDTQYVGLGLSGTLISNLYYDVYGWFGAGRTLTYLSDDESITGSSYGYQPVFSFLSGGSMTYLIEEALYSMIRLELAVSSGDGDHESYIEGNSTGISTMFIPMSSKEIGIAYEPYLGNMAFLKASYGIKPFSGTAIQALQEFQTELRGIGFLRPTTGAVSSSYDQSSNQLYLGTEVDAVINYRPFSDLGTALSFGFFFPNSAAMPSTLSSPWYVGKLEFSLQI